MGKTFRQHSHPIPGPVSEPAVNRHDRRRQAAIARRANRRAAKIALYRASATQMFKEIGK